MPASNPQSKQLRLDCKKCGHQHQFDQPYPYHAGFSDVGFLYNESGNATLVWSMYDPYFFALFPGKAAWSLSVEERTLLERKLPPSPLGDRWAFSAHARCEECHASISPPIGESIYYLLFPESVRLTGVKNGDQLLEHYIKGSGV